MNRRWIAATVSVLILGWAGAFSTTVDHGWTDGGYRIRVHGIDAATDSDFLLSTFYLVNDGKWEIVRDNVNDAILFATGAHSTLEDAGIEGTFKAFEELELTLPARLVAEGDTLAVYVMWVDTEEPTAQFVVEAGGPEPSEVVAGPTPTAAPFGALPLVRTPPLLEVTVETASDGGADVAIRNPGRTIFVGTLNATAALSYYRDWIGESVTRFLDRTLGRVMLAPEATLLLTVRTSESPDETYLVTFLDLLDRTSGGPLGEPLVVAVPQPTERAIAAFRDMIYNVWTGLSDKEPETDYIDLGFGIPGVHLYFPIAPYFPPPR